MCGITGKIYFDPKRKVNFRELKQMTDVIRHRGPDDEGHYVEGNVGLGFRRLSIIDLSAGHQPLADNSGRYVITFNGEVYNFQEERKELEKKGYHFKTNTDTEVIVNLYAEHKEKCLEYLRGMFAFVIWDKKERILFGARDRFGIKPFHYYMDNEKFVWGSEIKSIVVSSEIDKTLSLESLDYYFAYGYSKRERTIYEHINKLQPAQYFILKPENNRYNLSFHTYWNINFEPDESKSEQYWKEQVYKTLNESVKMRMISDVPLGAFLSGGIDSSTVVSLMALNSSQPIKTFSIGFKEEKYNELKYARLVAEKYHTEYHEMIVEPESIELLPKLVAAYDEPFADSSAIPTYYVSKFTREYVTVALSGDGGDELFAGYNSYPKMMNLYRAFYNNSFSNKFVFNPINKLIPDYLYGKGYSYFLSKNKKDIGAYFCFWKDYERRKIFKPEVRNSLINNESEKYKIALQDSHCDFLSSMQKMDMQTYMVDDILTKVDRASMMNSLEVRVPILDHKFAELSFKIPSGLKLKGKSKKHILKESFKDILPGEILSHKKQGFGVPLSVWFKGDLKQYAYDTLLHSTYINEYLNKKQIEKILNNHQKGLRDYSAKIWSLLVLDEWMRQNK